MAFKAMRAIKIAISFNQCFVDGTGRVTSAFFLPVLPSRRDQLTQPEGTVISELDRSPAITDKS
ncbi:hypothetical protein [Bradyrhizobium sp. 174]|uniref:hypothetical protein n=1 Tax=Bradyrhizobium sp. 174 TaxID=2782645 RepID=UPI001FF788D1|nr:hypothetical protein [Bradyrhizobium sp. 174]MCK1575089.1 hypothetical protein [Bradyrhizobium sp. 174]